MVWFYNYIYYRAYQGWLQKKWGEGAAVWGSYIELCMLTAFTVLAIAELAQITTGYKVSDRMLYAPTWLQVVVILAFGFWMNRTWGSKKWARKIVSEFEKAPETPRQRFWRGMAINVYEAGWVILWFGSALFMGYHPQYG